MFRLTLEDPGIQPGGTWFVLGIPREPTESREVYSLEELALQDVTHIAVVNPEMGALLAESAPRLLGEFPEGSAGAIVLVRLKPCPWPEAVPDGRVYCFLCSADVFRQLLAQAPDALPWQLCFRLLYVAMNGRLELDKLLIRQLPYPDLSKSTGEKPPVSVIMAHRGSPEHLRTALHFLSLQNFGCLRTQIGLDVDDPAVYGKLIGDYPLASFFHVQPAPAGPYVIRQELAQLASPELLMLHDSDDVSCSDRGDALYSELSTSNCDFVGSHELRVDELSGEIFAIRFPLDVTAALKERAGHALLHGTGMIRRQSFFQAGGLSTDQIVANDTQFLFRAYFYLKIRNVNSFLYIRRRHADALTVAPETCNGIPLRLELDRQWRADFQRVKLGELTVAESSLRQMRAIRQHRLVAL